MFISLPWSEQRLLEIATPSIACIECQIEFTHRRLPNPCFSHALERLLSVLHWYSGRSCDQQNQWEGTVPSCIRRIWGATLCLYGIASHSNLIESSMSFYTGETSRFLPFLHLSFSPGRASLILFFSSSFSGWASVVVFFIFIFSCSLTTAFFSSRYILLFQA